MMNLKELINRPDQEALEHNEAIFIIEQYIKKRKNKDVNINIRPNLNDISLMMHAVNDAIIWFRINGV